MPAFTAVGTGDLATGPGPTLRRERVITAVETTNKEDAPHVNPRRLC
jgi:hypothetical protein